MTLLILTPLVSEALKAQEIPESFHPVRPMAMGGAFTAVANDENAVWTNPAGVSRIRKARSRGVVNLVKFPNAIAGANTAGRTFYTSITQAGDEETAAAISEASQNEAIADKPFWAMAAAFPMMMFDFGRQLASVLGAFSHTTMKAVIDSDNPQQTTTEVVSDIGGVLSFSVTNHSNRFNLGFQVRSIGRYAFEDTIATTTLFDDKELETVLKENSNQSVGLAVDAGMMFTLADFWFPTIGISVLNAPLSCKKDYLNPFSKTRETVCGTVFSGSFANPDAISTVDPTDIRAGISITPRITRKIALRIALDAHHIHTTSGDNNYGLSDIPVLKTLHGGVELITGNPLLPSPFSVAVGLSQGYYTMGASVRLSFLSLDIATFGRDISSDDNPQEDRRVMGGFSLDF